MSEGDQAIAICEGPEGGLAVVFVDAGFAARAGRPAGEALGRPLPEALAAAPDRRAALEAALAAARPFSLTVSPTPDTPSELAGAPLPPGAAPPTVWVVRLAAPGTTAGAPEAGFVDALPLSLVLYDSDDRLVWFNRTYREVLGPNARLLARGKRFAEIMAAAYRAGHAGGGGDIEARIAERLARHRARATFEEQLSGGRWLLTREIGLTGGGILGVRSDITAAKRAASGR